MTLSLFSPNLAQAEEWDCEIELYLLVTNIEGDSGIDRADGVEVDVDFGGILAVLNMAGMVRFEAIHDSGWGTVLDYSFMDLRDDISGPQGGVADFKIRQGVLQGDLFLNEPLSQDNARLYLVCNDPLNRETTLNGERK